MRTLLYVAILVIPAQLLASEPDSLEQLRQDIEDLTRRLVALENENETLRRNFRHRDQTPEQDDQPGEPNTQSSSTKTNFSGDFRLRHERIDLRGAEVHERARIRARATVTRQINENAEVGLGVSTGGNAPTSSTQTLGAGGSKKSVALDLAYIDWQPKENLHVFAGKFKNHLFKVPSQTMLWDDEWRPEGAGLSFDTHAYFVSLLGTWIESDSLSPDREFAFGAQTGIRRPILGEAVLTAGIGYFNFSVANASTFYGSDIDFSGNTFSCANPIDTSTCKFGNDYEEVEMFAAIAFDRDKYSGEVYAHYVQNREAGRLNDGWTIGSQFLFNSGNHPVQLHYFYRYLEADAVFAPLTDSDFGGGGTDVTGHSIKVGWSMNPRLVLSLVYFDNDIGSNQGMSARYKRAQVNADFNF